MAKSQAQSTGQNTLSLLERVTALLIETDAVYRLGDKAPKERVTTLLKNWSGALSEGDDRGALVGYLMVPLIAGAFEDRILNLVFEDRRSITFYSDLATDWRAVIDATGIDAPPAFNRFHAGKALDALDAKTAELPKGGSLLGFAQRTEATRGIGSRLLAWVEKPTHREDARSKVALVVEANAPIPPDPRVELQSKLEAAQARKTQALEAEDYTVAATAKQEIAQLETELAALDTKTEKLEPVPTLASTPPTPTSVVVSATQPTDDKPGKKKGLGRKIAEATGIVAPMPNPATTVAPAAILAPAGPNGKIVDLKTFKGQVKATDLGKELTDSLLARFVKSDVDAVAAVEAFQTLTEG